MGDGCCNDVVNIVLQWFYVGHRRSILSVGAEFSSRPTHTGLTERSRWFVCSVSVRYLFSFFLLGASPILGASVLVLLSRPRREIAVIELYRMLRARLEDIYFSYLGPCRMINKANERKEGNNNRWVMAFSLIGHNPGWDQLP